MKIKQIATKFLGFKKIKLSRLIRATLKKSRFANRLIKNSIQIDWGERKAAKKTCRD